jgi:hypothetical protein
VGLVRFRSAPTEKENNFLVGLTPFRKSMCDLGKFPNTTIHHHPYFFVKNHPVLATYIDRSPSASFGMWRTQPFFQVEIAERNDGG